MCWSLQRSQAKNSTCLRFLSFFSLHARLPRGCPRGAEATQFEWHPKSLRNHPGPSFSMPMVEQSGASRALLAAKLSTNWRDSSFQPPRGARWSSHPFLVLRSPRAPCSLVRSFHVSQSVDRVTNIAEICATTMVDIFVVGCTWFRNLFRRVSSVDGVFKLFPKRDVR